MGHPREALRACRFGDEAPARLPALPYRIAAYGATWAQSRWHMQRFRRLLPEIERQGRICRGVTDEALLAMARECGAELRRRGFPYRTVARAFALVREAAARHLGMRHHDCQLRGGWAMLWGAVAEMATGEGKTLTATLPVATMALAGVPVHVVSVNDYLTARDAEQMRPLYAALGLRTAAVVADLDLAGRRAAYRADITYCTNKELVFDYLRDGLEAEGRTGRIVQAVGRLRGRRSAMPEPRLGRGLGFVLIDEADSVLVDEARTPLIIAGGKDGSEAEPDLVLALEIAARLVEDEDFVIDHRRSRIDLTEAGRARIHGLARGRGGLWRGGRAREELLVMALSALHRQHRDEHYMVEDGRIVIIDEYTGRTMPDRSWSRGLHQLVEIKEGCPPSRRHGTLAQISYQAFFRRYPHRSGMTGTAREIAREIGMNYRLPVVGIATHRPVARRDLGTRIHARLDEADRHLVEVVEAMRRADRPTLVGTRTVAVAEHLSRVFAEAGIDHQVLSARQNADEAAIIAGAGRAGRVTIATNMAGRGTDIPLDDRAREAGGLHVVLTEYHSARRIDRQLIGRCARQGDPGSSQAILCLERLEGLEDLGMTRRTLRALIALGLLDSVAGQWWARRSLARAQRRLERRHFRMRQDLLRADKEMGKMMAFSGRSE